ncbi:MAG: hypothetical protein QXJ75_05330 [Candidatus Bathyarchaeia archaeon]
MPLKTGFRSWLHRHLKPLGKLVGGGRNLKYAKIAVTVAYTIFLISFSPTFMNVPALHPIFYWWEVHDLFGSGPGHHQQLGGYLCYVFTFPELTYPILPYITLSMVTAFIWYYAWRFVRRNSNTASPHNKWLLTVGSLNTLYLFTIQMFIMPHLLRWPFATTFLSILAILLTDLILTTRKPQRELPPPPRSLGVSTHGLPLDPQGAQENSTPNRKDNIPS